MKRGAVYARLSDVRKGDSDGIERQLRETEAHAEHLGVEVVERLVDNDVSASKKGHRPAFDRLMEGIAGNEWDVVILRSLDRWVRRPAELEQIIEVVEKSNVRIEVIHGQIELRTRSGRLNARVVTAVAMNEAEAITERVVDWHKDRAARGLALHGPPGYGYMKVDGETLVVEEEAERIREAAARVLSGHPLRDIARDWNERAVPAPGGAWRAQTIRRILLAPRTAGLRVHRGEVVGPAVWAPILDRVTFDELGRFLNQSHRRAPGGRGAKLLTGIASCGRCENTLNSKVVQGARRYFCRHCYGVTVYADRLEEHVVADLCAALDSPQLRDRIAGLPDLDAEQIAGQILEVEAQAESLAAEVGSGLMQVTEWKIARTALNTRLEALRADLARCRGDDARSEWVGRGSELAASWGALPDQRRVLAAFIADVKVGPATRGVNRFQPSRVSIEWRA